MYGLIAVYGLMLSCIGSFDGLMLSCISSSDGLMLSCISSSDGLMLSCIGSSDGLMPSHHASLVYRWFDSYHVLVQDSNMIKVNYHEK